jgi:hypothetical protein
MENRIDQLFKKRLGGAVSTDSPMDKAATLDALTKSKGKFRFWMILPLLILLGGAGWALYEFRTSQIATATNPSGNILSVETLSKGVSSKEAVSSKSKIQSTTIEENSIDDESMFPESRTVKKQSQNAQSLMFNSNEINHDVIVSAKTLSTNPEEYQLSSNDVRENDIPNDHSVDHICGKNGQFAFEPVTTHNSLLMELPKPAWTVTARGLVGGAMPVFGNVESQGGKLRDEYEKMGVTYGAELGIERTFGKWRVGSGVGSMNISNNVEYPVLERSEEYTVDSTMWTIITISYYEVDSTFSPTLGNWIYDTTYFSEIDSIGTDTSWIELAQIANGSLQKGNGRNTISVISIPLQLQYKLFETDKIGSIHAMAGFQWVYAYRRRGYYVKDSGQDLVGISEDASFKRMNIHLNIGLDWRYPITDRLFTTIQPVLNYSVLDWQSSYDQRFITPMLKFGVGWRLK